MIFLYIIYHFIYCFAAFFLFKFLLFIVTLFHYFGIDVYILTSPSSVRSYPPKPNIILCNTPPAPVIKYGFEPPIVYANTPKGYLKYG